MKANASMEKMLRNDVLLDAEHYTKELIDNEDVIKIKSGTTCSKRGNKTHYSPSDPESKIATKPGKPYRLNYLGQIVVDTGSHVITHAQAFKADQRDSQCLEAIISNTQNNIAEGGLVLHEILADTNYSSTKTLEDLEEKNIRGYIPNFGGFKATREGFEYDKINDRYICSQGKFLENKGRKKNHYLSSVKDCKGCSFKEQCIGKSNQKMITETLSRPLFLEMDKRIKSQKGKRMRRLRQSTVEPVIGSITEYHGAKKTLTKGLKSASKHLILSAIAYNLKKLIRFNKKTAKTNYLEILEALFIDTKLFFNKRYNYIPFEN